MPTWCWKPAQTLSGHINGGHSALPDDQIVCLCEGCSAGLEIVHNGNERSAVLALNTARELGKLDQIILGTDGPAGSGVQPLGILRMVAMLSALAGVPAELALCFATGNTARQREPGYRDHRDRQGRRLRADGPGAAFARQEHARVDPPGKPSRYRHGRDRWRRALQPQPQHAAGGENSNDHLTRRQPDAVFRKADRVTVIDHRFPGRYPSFKLYSSKRLGNLFRIESRMGKDADSRIVSGRCATQELLATAIRSDPEGQNG
jgi:hypothetical protein